MKKRPIRPSYWSQYSRRLVERILSPHNVGSFAPNRFLQSEMRVVVGRAEEVANWGIVVIYLVVDQTDGIIADAKFQAIGHSALIGAADAGCEVLIRKNYDQAKRLTTDLLDRKLRDFDHIAAFPNEVGSQLNLVLEAIDFACEQCVDIPIADPSYAPPVPMEVDPSRTYPNWELMTKEEKIALITKILTEEVQPYIELDAGGIQLLSFHRDREVVIAYQGACTSCPSATGATLHAIENILRAKAHPEIVVKPDPSFLTF